MVLDIREHVSSVLPRLYLYLEYMYNISLMNEMAYNKNKQRGNIYD